MDKHTAKVSTTIDAPPAEVWAALTEPDLIKQYFFGADVDTDWEEGSPIRFSGEWEGKSYEDKGEVLEVEEEKHLAYFHWSPMSGKPDKPENYHRVAYDLEPAGGDATKVTITQEQRGPEGLEQSEKNWRTVLDGLKSVVEH